MGSRQYYGFSYTPVACSICIASRSGTDRLYIARFIGPGACAYLFVMGTAERRTKLWYRGKQKYRWKAYRESIILGREDWLICGY